MWLGNDGTIRISGRTLGELALPAFCERCFWIKRHLKRKPFDLPFPGIFSSIDAYSKHVIHAYFRKHGRAPEYLSPICNDLQDYVSSGLHQSRYRYVDPKTGICVTGAPDDIFIAGNGDYHLIDYKTARFTEKQDELYPLYEIQLNAYAFIAERADKFRPMKSLTLVYTEPVTGDISAQDRTNWLPRGFKLGFAAYLRPVPLDLGKIPPLLEQVRKILALKKPPDQKPGCEDCQAVANLDFVCAGIVT